MKLALAAVAALLLSICTWPVSAKTLDFGVVPQQSAKKMISEWSPLIDFINTHSELSFRLVSAKDITTFEQQLLKGQFDVAYVNPLQFIKANKTQGYQALAKQKSYKLTGVVVVREDSDVQTVQELADKTIAFPSPNAFAASVLPQMSLDQADIPIRPKYVMSHDQVYLHVAKGRFSAGGGVMSTYMSMPKAIQNQLRVIWRTTPYTPHAITAHPRLDTETQNELKVVLMKMNQSAPGQSALASIRFNGLEAAANQDWDDVRTLFKHATSLSY